MIRIPKPLVLITFLLSITIMPTSCVVDSLKSFDEIVSENDTDGDGIIDANDRCPNDSGPAILQGCPDRDEDGVPDIDDLCELDSNKTEPGICGCGEEDKDTDGDGVLDCNDDCPTVSGLEANNGCLPGEEDDRDGDGIKNDVDLCPDDSGLASNNGCPDKDGDGVLDKDDDCDDDFGPASNNGCPIDNFVEITGGSFQMGNILNDADKLQGVPPPDEFPVHTVSLDDFMMSPTEVTNKEFADFLNDEGNVFVDGDLWYDIDSAGAQIQKSNGVYSVISGFEQHPVVHLNWYASVSFCNWKSDQAQLQRVYTISGTSVIPNWSANGYRLPTEAEWEYAASEGGKSVRFGNGEDIAKDSEVNFKASVSTSYSAPGESRGGTLPVNTLKTNSFGLYHMSGNVGERCWDWYDRDYYAVSDMDNPRGPEMPGNSGEGRVWRGGTWNNDASRCRVSERDWNIPTRNKSVFGFRLVRNAQ